MRRSPTREIPAGPLWDGSRASSAVCGDGLDASNQKSEIINQKSIVRLGDCLALKSGLVEITYDTGAKVLLQGPVTYEVESPAGGYLSIGKLTAKLEERSEARGQRSEVGSQRSESANRKSEIRNEKFVVRTPTATIADLGTEFGVAVGNDGRTVSRVFRGAITMQAMSSDGNREGDVVVLRKNESSHVDRPDGRHPPTVRRGDAEHTYFVRADQLSKRIEADRLKPFHRWQVQRRTLQSDPSVVVYYDFQQTPGSPAVLRNVAANGDASLDGAIEGAVWTTGRMPGKEALYFDGQGAHVKVNIPKRLTQVTVSAWLTIETIDDQAVLGCLLMSDLGLGHSPESCHWEIKHSGEVFFSSMAFFNHTTGTPVSWQTWGSNRWRHVALSVDPGKRQVICYVDGRKQDFALAYPGTSRSSSVPPGSAIGLTTSGGATGASAAALTSW